MAFTKKTIKDLNIRGKTVLLRVDYNLPIDSTGKVTNWYRLQESLPTLKYLLRQNCKIIIISHLGRPEGKFNSVFSLEKIALKLQKILNKKVYFVQDCIGPDISEKAKSLKPQEVLLLQNVRFHREEEQNDKQFAKQLASLAEVFVQDGFGVVHRAHASTTAITKYLPSVAGLLLEKEVDTITSALEAPARPQLSILGGAKVSDKIELLQNLLKKADYIAIGGAMANTFLSAADIGIGKSIYESSAIPAAKRILELAQKAVNAKKLSFYLPQDGLCAKSLAKREKVIYQGWGQAAAVIPGSALPSKANNNAQQHGVAENLMILDIGENSQSEIKQVIANAKTILWNGPVGYTELEQFSQGSKNIAKAIADSPAKSILGGGDTAGFIESQGLADKFDWVSTGGGASLELMAGRRLPGVEALIDK